MNNSAVGKVEKAAHKTEEANIEEEEAFSSSNRARTSLSMRAIEPSSPGAKPFQNHLGFGISRAALTRPASCLALKRFEVTYTENNLDTIALVDVGGSRASQPGKEWHLS